MKRNPVILGLVLAALAVLLAVSPALAGPPSLPYLVKDINTSGSSSPSELTDLNGTLMFSAKGTSRGRELWRSDGTSNGTMRVKDINPGKAGSGPAWLEAIDGHLYFQANDGSHGFELWASDGTGAGTKLIKDIRPGSQGSNPRCFTALGGLVYFFAETGQVGAELWRTDGTAAGTSSVKDLEPGVDGYNDCPLVLGPRMYFIHSSDWAVGNDTLFVSDGTSMGTKPFKDANGKIVRGMIENITMAGSRMFFLRNSNLWRSDGTPSTTRKISNISGGITAVDSTAYIWRTGSTVDSLKSHIWQSDGTKAATLKVIDLPDIGIHSMTSVGTLLFFAAGPMNEVDRLWTSDGTSGGTQPLETQVRQTTDGVALGNVFYFGGYSPEEYDTYAGPACSAWDIEGFLWRSDATAAGTYDVNPDLDYCLDNLTAVGNSVYFVSNAGGYGNELWRYVP